MYDINVVFAEQCDVVCPYCWKLFPSVVEYCDEGTCGGHGVLYDPVAHINHKCNKKPQPLQPGSGGDYAN